jgi:hypothetical protein
MIIHVIFKIFVDHFKSYDNLYTQYDLKFKISYDLCLSHSL